MKTLLITFLMALGITCLVVSCGTENNETKGSADTKVAHTDTMSQEQLVERGEYLVTSIGCDDCHTPKVFGANGPIPDMEKRLSGHPADLKPGPVDAAMLKDYVLFNHHFTSAAGPWGVSFAANLTSDATGIGNWEEENFIRAIREGKNKGMVNGRPLLPPMPWPNYKNLTDDDLKALFAFLKSTKPVNNLVPAPMKLEELPKK